MRRGLDIAVALVGLLVLSPLLVLLGGALLAGQGRPILFGQWRAGINGEPFRLWKLRTMSDERDAEGRLLPDELRVTRLGRFLRASSIDELPALWNVLLGHMSLIGPRPLPTRYLPRYTAEEARRHEVRPGMTGWAQVNGRNALGWEERLAMDVWYVDHRSVGLDLRIILRTIAVVFLRHGTSGTPGSVITELRPDSARADGGEGGGPG